MLWALNNITNALLLSSPTFFLLLLYVMLLQAPAIAFAVLFQFCPKQRLTCQKSFVCFEQLWVEPVHKCLLLIHSSKVLRYKFPSYKCCTETHCSALTCNMFCTPDYLYFTKAVLKIKFRNSKLCLKKKSTNIKKRNSHLAFSAVNVSFCFWCGKCRTEQETIPSVTTSPGSLSAPTVSSTSAWDVYHIL